MNSTAAHIGGMCIPRGNRQGPLARLHHEIWEYSDRDRALPESILWSVGKFDDAEGRPRVLVLGNGPKSKQLEFAYE
jgi:hypothetical protein